MRWPRSLRARRRGASLVVGAALAAAVSLIGAPVAFADLLPSPAVPTPSLPSVPQLPIATPSLPPVSVSVTTTTTSTSVAGQPVTAPLPQVTITTSSTTVPNVPPTPGLPVGGGSGGGCVVTVTNTCVLGTTSTGTRLPSSSGLPIPAPGPTCVGSVACVNPSCVTAGTPGCAVTTPAANPPSSPRPGGSAGTTTGTGGSSGGSGGSGPGGSGSGSGSGGGFGSFNSGTAVNAPQATQAASAVDIGAVPVVQQLGVLPGLAFGHVALLIPLFIVIDVLAVIGLIAVVRRYWAAPVSD